MQLHSYANKEVNERLIKHNTKDLLPVFQPTLGEVSIKPIPSVTFDFHTSSLSSELPPHTLCPGFPTCRPRKVSLSRKSSCFAFSYI